MNGTDALRHDQNALLAELELAGARIKSRNSIHCPFHSDSRPSSGIYLGEDGVWRFKCHGCGFCGDMYDVRARATNKPLDDVLKESRPNNPPPPKEAIYNSIEALCSGLDLQASPYRYTNPATGVVEMVVIRFTNGTGKKAFIQCSPVSGGWIRRSPPKPLPLYNRTRTLQADTVVVVEGEKCVHALTEIGFVAVTSPGGAGNAKSADWTPLAGKRVYLWPDNDPNGLKYIKDVADIIEKLSPPAECFWIDPQKFGLPDKFDAADFIDDFGDMSAHLKAEQVQNVLDSAISKGPAAEVFEIFDDIHSGKRKVIDWPWKSMGQITKAMYPGTVTIICGTPGASKSFMLLEAVTFWHQKGLKCALYELEENRAYHMRRALAQLAENGKITDDDWIKHNPAEKEILKAKYAADLDSLGRVLFQAPDKQLTLDDIVAWIKKQVSSGAEIIALDPITSAAPTGKPWIADNEFLMQVKPIIHASGVRLILITHPKKGQGRVVGLDELAGGAAYQRLSQTILWQEFHEKPQTAEIISEYGIRETITHNRTVHVCKTRNGRGTGKKIACQFDSKTLKLCELGVIQ